MATTAYLAGQAGLWVQPDGPNTEPKFLGCHGMGDITIPFGDKTLVYCPDPASHGKFKVVASYRGEPGSITSSINTVVGSAADWLETISEKGCPFTLFVHKTDCGRRDTFTSYTRSFILGNVEVSQHTLSNLAARSPGDEGESTQAFDLNADDFFSIREVTVDRSSIAETTSLNDIATCNERQCKGDCGDAKDPCDDLIVASDAPAGSPAVGGDVWYTLEGGSWTQSLMDPFAAGEDVISIVCFPVGPTTTRWLAAREAVAATPMEVSYSDDNGANWTEVTVGAVNQQGANYGGALFALDTYHIWLVTDGGYVYFSDDGGVTWTAQDSGVATAQDLNAVWFADENNGMAVGDSDAVIYTSDGGTTWSAGTATGSGQNLLTVCENEGGDIWWTGTSGGRMYYSDDLGTTWTRRSGWSGDGTGQVRDIEFASELVGFMVHNSAAPVGTFFRTIDGGYTWEAQTTPTNVGLNSVIACDPNNAFAAGEASGGTGMVLKLHD